MTNVTAAISRMLATMEVVTRRSSSDVLLGSAGSLFVAYYRAQTTLATLELLDTVQTEMLASYSHLSTLTIIGQLGALKVDDAVRDRSVVLGKKYEKQVRGSAIVVTTRGLAAVMVRTFLTGFFLLSRAETPVKTFSSVAEALGWLQSLPGQDLEVKLNVTSQDVERFIATPAQPG